ncbi:DUF1264 domain-containing protein [Chitinasiproducens palmae]|uniref:DUF1264 domain-containing protein n=1 Tax=Chitinasiproducens palmae TaxID=1770053 RepID=UPI000AFF1DF5|nr:DUF1264 domain-containing protein [Chitinasiproducens palmae]
MNKAPGAGGTRHAGQRDTDGKTFHTGHTDRDKTLPLGVPQLMMGFTKDGQVDPAMVKARDERLGIDSAARRRAREDISSPPVDTGADAWQQRHVVQFADPTGAAHAGHGSAASHAAFSGGGTERAKRRALTTADYRRIPLHTADYRRIPPRTAEPRAEVESTKRRQHAVRRETTAQPAHRLARSPISSAGIVG